MRPRPRPTHSTFEPSWDLKSCCCWPNFECSELGHLIITLCDYFLWLMQPQTMEQLMAILAERDAAIQERNLALSEKKAVLAQRDLAILERDAAIVERDNALLERDNVISTLRYRGNSMNSCNCCLLAES
ncbi:protein BASIC PENTACYSTEINE6-like isoform X2 [Vitis vinifera]|uniref:protein BASIC PENTACYSTEINE6-like isoform X2 n=1 Tax=Vitis vinifera TaxID=29760 RepID=UPI00053FF4EB|nr:protein BASIC PENTACYSTEINE6-like isoform X2 [Vitis vinifera]|eukprot:XP_010664774.1 PREDICTED: protein BASIC PENTACYSTEINE6 isoform X2 [Vitis vinifera]